VPLVSGSSWSNNVTVAGFSTDPDVDANARTNHVGPGFFATLGIPRRAGRDFNERDDRGAPKVAIVNQAFARKFGLGDGAVGTRMAIGRGGELDIEIVGLVADSAYSEVKDDPPPVFYLPWRQSDEIGALNYYLRSPLPSEQLYRSLRAAAGRVAPGLPLENLAPLAQRVSENVFMDRLLSLLSAGFAALATLLAAIGLYGVLAYAVAQRTHEIGVRVAVGADPRSIRRLILRQVVGIAGVGALVGLLVGGMLGRLAAAILYRLEGTDPPTLAGAAALLAAVTLLTGLLPARRAARIDPVAALRGE
jgi:predicted permease